MRESPEIAAEFSFEKEKAIAKSFSQRFQWEMILIGLIIVRRLYGVSWLIRVVSKVLYSHRLLL